MPVDRQTVSFGEGFEFEVQARALRRRGRAIRLERIPAELLALLVERDGGIVSRESIVERIWGTDVFLDTDNSINVAVRKIRQALKDDPEHPKYIQTITGRGYRFIAHTSPDIEQVAVGDSLPSGALPHQSSALPPESPPLRSEVVQRPKVRRGLALAACSGLLALVAALMVVVLRATAAHPPPKAVTFDQTSVSDSADPWQPLITDGPRVYFAERNGDHSSVLQTSSGGGDVRELQVPFRNTRLFAISRRHSEFLIGSFGPRRSQMPLWIWPVQGGAPVRVGQVVADDATWCPDADCIVYSLGSDVRRVRRDGSGDELLAHTGGVPKWFAWSPSGDRFTFTIANQNTGEVANWEARGDGTDAQRMRLPASDGRDPQCCGVWTPDGRYFVYTTYHNGIANLWAVAEAKSWWPWSSGRTVQLTSGAVSVFHPLPLEASNRYFAFVEGYQFESAVQEKGDQYKPLLPGRQILTLSFSSDGEWAAYHTYPDWTLWRSRVDGTDRIQLTAPPLKAAHPQWSPDGTRIAFEASTPGHRIRAYTVSANGGPVEELLPASPGEQSLPRWSPDGLSLAVAMNVDVQDAPVAERGIFLIDHKTRTMTKVPASEGLTSPFWSPDGSRFVARTPDDRQVVEFDRPSKTWHVVYKGGALVSPMWAPDSKSLYVQEAFEPGLPIYRIDSRLQISKVASFEQFLTSGARRVLLEAITPSGSLVLQFQRGGARVYSLDLEFP